MKKKPSDSPISLRARLISIIDSCCSTLEEVDLFRKLITKDSVNLPMASFNTLTSLFDRSIERFQNIGNTRPLVSFPKDLSELPEKLLMARGQFILCCAGDEKIRLKMTPETEMNALNTAIEIARKNAPAAVEEKEQLDDLFLKGKKRLVELRLIQKKGPKPRTKFPPRNYKAHYRT